MTDTPPTYTRRDLIKLSEGELTDLLRELGKYWGTDSHQQAQQLAELIRDEIGYRHQYGWGF